MPAHRQSKGQLIPNDAGGNQAPADADRALAGGDLDELLA
jgi:hypothetical protein